MIQFLTALVPLIGGFTQPIKDYFSFKKQQADKAYDLELAKIEAEKQAVISTNESRTQQIRDYLGAVSKSFRQFTFFFFMIPFVISMFFPEYAKVMWTNFYAIPQEFRYLFISIYSVIWGLPIADEYIGKIFGAVGRGLQAKRVYKIQKYNAKAAFSTLRKHIFTDGMTQEQVNIINKALKAYKESE